MSILKRNIALVGGGGHCKSCIDVIESTDKFNIVGILDKTENLGKKILDYEIIGTDENIKELARKGILFLITVGQIKEYRIRLDLFNKIKRAEGNLPTIVSEKAYVSKYAFIDEGTIVMHNAIINAKAKIGKNSIINTSSIIEHDVCIGDFCHISTGTILNGSVAVGSRVFIGSNTTVNNNCKIGNDIIIGSSSLINRDVDDNSIVAGIPAKCIN